MKADNHRTAATAWQYYYDGRPGILKRALAGFEFMKDRDPESFNRATRRKYLPSRAGRNHGSNGP